MSNKLLTLLAVLPLAACVQMADPKVDTYQYSDLRDDDQDGIINQRDLCQQTPDIAAVDNQGCALWALIDQIDRVVVEFDYNQSVIRPSQKGQVAEIKTILQQKPQAKVILVGDTSSEGSLSYNSALAERRNQAVKAALMQQGVSSSRIETQVFNQDTNLTQYLKKRQRRTIAVISHNEHSVTSEWNIYSSQERADKAKGGR
ncbi:OmpA family protein [Motilimonas pumila]|uniref:OmpA family protein n=1 Tax=Motilimonas pumila TaxID=2303987 RepID=A0A418YFF2_9GAMM|nr:OmpA family protein [Motilimonas pumila]RJG47963.1 OmpA family protein [Motilimonas pumila]